MVSIDPILSVAIMETSAARWIPVIDVLDASVRPE
jgi:hypothetical protein